MRRNKNIQDILQGEDTVQFAKYLQDDNVMLKECKTKEFQNTLQQLQWKEQQKDDDIKDREMRMKGI
jgi:hypothetical protein